MSWMPSLDGDQPVTRAGARIMGFDYDLSRYVSIQLTSLRSQDQSRAALQTPAAARQEAMQEPRGLLYRPANGGRQGQVCSEWSEAECNGIRAGRFHLMGNDGLGVQAGVASAATVLAYLCISEGSMAGTIFAYHEGYLRVRFRPADHGDFLIDLHISADAVSNTAVDDGWNKGRVSTHLGNDLQVTMATSPTECRFFGDMVRWLEAMITGVQECAFRWENEGPEGRLHWRNHWDGRGILHLTWDGGREQAAAIDRRFLLDRTQVVGAFYDALHEMTASATYDRLAHEPVAVGECLDLIMDTGDRDRFAGFLAAKDRDRATRLLDALLAHAYDAQLGNPRVMPLGRMAEEIEGTGVHAALLSAATSSQWLSDGWDDLPEAERLAEIESLCGAQAWYAVGERLTGLRSEPIEAWLGREATRGSS